MMIKNILVTGANGQLGNEMQVIAASYPEYDFLFVTKELLPIEDIDAVQHYFTANNIEACINCAAYTAVDKAETETAKAFAVNVDAVVKLHGKCLIVTEEQQNNSFAEALAGRISKHCFKSLDAPVEVLGALNLPAVPMNMGLEKAMLPNADKVTAVLQQLLAR